MKGVGCRVAGVFLRCTAERGQADACTARANHACQSNLDAVYVYVVPWSEFPIVPSYPHYPQRVPANLDDSTLETARGTTRISTNYFIKLISFLLRALPSAQKATRYPFYVTCWILAQKIRQKSSTLSRLSPDIRGGRTAWCVEWYAST